MHANLAIVMTVFTTLPPVSLDLYREPLDDLSILDIRVTRS